MLPDSGEKTIMPVFRQMLTLPRSGRKGHGGGDTVIGRMFQWMAASPPRVLVFGFAAIVALGTAVLKLPVMAADGRPTPLIDALFTAVSAVCVTGLTPLDFAGHWSFAGQLTVLVLVQFGGFGFMTLATMAAIVLRRRITLRERIILQESFNQAGIEGVVRLVLKVIRYTLILESAGAAVLTIRDRKSTRLNSSHVKISYAVFCL